MNNKFSRRIQAILYHNICYACNAEFGEKNKSRKFYVIRCPHSTLGFFGLYNYVVYHIKKAIEMGKEPIVDWKYYPNSSVINNTDFSKINAWTYYFEPILDISLDEVYESKNVFMCSGKYDGSLGEAYDINEILNSYNIIKKYMIPNKRILELFNKKINDFSMKNEKILGILCRGTDFCASKPQFHTICPTATQMIEIIDSKMKEWGYYEHIFLATEDKTILNVLKEKYGNRLLVNQNEMIEYKGSKWLNEMYNQIEEGRNVKISTEYFISILLLSECDALIAPLVGGTLGAIRIKGGYSKIYLTELGLY